MVKMFFNKLQCILCTIYVLYLDLIYAQLPHKRFEYKYSFKPPYLAQKDGSVPFWEYGGNAIASQENVRLAPSLRSQKGAIWTKQPITFDWWEVDIMFKVTGRGRIGADGLAFWYTANKGEYNGDVFGSSDKWIGLGIIFDSFDNDNKHNNPYIMAAINDGTKSFDHKNDGSNLMNGGCLRDFRNKPFPTRARVEYYLNTLTVSVHTGMTNNLADYELCFRLENIFLPKGGFFGLSAATGGLADDHDVIHLLTTSIYPPGTAQGAVKQQIGESEQQKLSQEYTEYQHKLDVEKEKYRKEHPDEVHDKEDMDDWFESDNQRELRQIFQGQAAIFDTLRDLNKKVDEVIGKQATSLSLLSTVYTNAQQGQPAQPGQVPQQIPQLPIARHDWDALVQNHNVMVSTLGELKNVIYEVSRKADAAMQNKGTAQITGGTYDSQQFNNEIRDGINVLKTSVASMANRMQAQPQMASCPQVTCVTTTLLLVALAVQISIMFLYSLYKERKEAQAKKFF